jgi:hypothetical protein
MEEFAYIGLMEKTWFEFREIRRRRLGDSVWIPLHVSEYVRELGTYGYAGFVKEYYGLDSVAVPILRRDDANKLRWSELGGHSQGIWATKEYYKPAEVYQYHDKEDLGIDLVLVQRFSTEDQNEWHLNQDIVIALGLKRERDVWLKPDEDYAEVARLRRSDAGKPVALEIKNDFLRDYLCARQMFLRTSMYRERAIIAANPADAGSPEPVTARSETENFELRLSPMIEGGHFGDGGYAVFHIGRTDVDPDEDVPVPGPETEANTQSKSWYGKHEGDRLWYVTGELWRDENIEPAANSPRVRGDKIPSGLNFIVDAAGNRATSEDLHDQDNARWLWFRPEVIPAITNRRSGSFDWYTMDTGGVGLSTYALTHFGINRLGLVNVYAYDIAKLAAWQQQVWAGYNVVPEGGVSEELLMSQMRAEPANTMAPERALPEIMGDIDHSFVTIINVPLFRPHSETQTILRRITRFRALEPGGLFALAKDLMRLVADQIDMASLQKVVPPPAGEKWGSLKSLENYLATIVPADQAHLLMGPLFGAYDLRLADAHMPRSELDPAYRLVQVDPNSIQIEQGFRLVASVVSSLVRIGRLLREHVESVSKRT